MTAPKPNAELAYRVLDHIDAHPETWRQEVWDCGTAACFAGWAVRLSGGVSDGGDVVAGPDDLVDRTVESAAYRALNITAEQSEADGGAWLFHMDNTRADLGELVAEIFGPRPTPEHRCPNCAPCYDCERGIYVPDGAA